MLISLKVFKTTCTDKHLVIHIQKCDSQQTLGAVRCSFFVSGQIKWGNSSQKIHISENTGFVQVVSEDAFGQQR